jgi:hypothetical protein
MAVGGRLEVPGYPGDQMRQVIRSPEPIGSAGTMAYGGALEKDGAVVNKSGTQDKPKSLVYGSAWFG